LASTAPVTVDDTLLNAQLQAVRDSLFGMVPPQTLWLADALQHSLGRTGKLLRPQMTLTCGLLLGCNNTHPLVEAAAVAEMIHMATLLHDDVLDDAALRRGLPTVKQKFGNEVAILSGDYLLAQASLKLSKIGNIRLVAIFSEVLAALCDGEVNQLCSRFQLDADMNRYLTKCQLKTACLFGAACEAAGVVADAPEATIQALKAFGLSYGTAFQLVDDLLDFTAESETLGKPVMGDICNGIATAPVILGLQHPTMQTAIRAEVDAIYAAVQSAQPVQARLAALKHLLQQAGTLGQTRQLAEQTLQDGLAQLPCNTALLAPLCAKVLTPLDNL
jgi:all-trans-nonaprenyl-diphosphate synthase